MKEIKVQTHAGEMTYTTENGVVSTAKKFDDSSTLKKWIVTSDPSQYVTGKVFNEFEECFQYWTMLKELPTTYYIIELHLNPENESAPPVALYVYDEEMKRTRII